MFLLLVNIVRVREVGEYGYLFLRGLLRKKGKVVYIGYVRI